MADKTPIGPGLSRPRRPIRLVLLAAAALAVVWLSWNQTRAAPYPMVLGLGLPLPGDPRRCVDEVIGLDRLGRVMGLPSRIRLGVYPRMADRTQDLWLNPGEQCRLHVLNAAMSLSTLLYATADPRYFETAEESSAMLLSTLDCVTVDATPAVDGAPALTVRGCARDAELLATSRGVFWGQRQLYTAGHPGPEGDAWVRYALSLDEILAWLRG